MGARGNRPLVDGRGERAGAEGAKGARHPAADVRHLVQCPLCGARFVAEESPACASCPRLLRSCRMVACPRCSHEFPRVA